MNELKTLKDITKRNFGWKLPENIPLEGVAITDLRQEAIKWVKEYRKTKNAFHEADWIDFFNIIDEDLK